MAQLTKERDHLFETIRTYRLLFETTRQLINEMQGQNQLDLVNGPFLDFHIQVLTTVYSVDTLEYFMLIFLYVYTLKIAFQIQFQYMKHPYMNKRLEENLESRTFQPVPWQQ